MATTSISHSSHNHPLYPVEFKTGIEFICDGCKTRGRGKSYRCNGCNFDLHDFCATCPKTIFSSVHPRHSLTLMTSEKAGPGQKYYDCYVCREPVEGRLYGCMEKECVDFVVHPVCSQQPAGASNGNGRTGTSSLKQIGINVVANVIAPFVLAFLGVDRD